MKDPDPLTKQSVGHCQYQHVCHNAVDHQWKQFPAYVHLFPSTGACHFHATSHVVHLISQSLGFTYINDYACHSGLLTNIVPDCLLWFWAKTSLFFFPGIWLLLQILEKRSPLFGSLFTYWAWRRCIWLHINSCPAFYEWPWWCSTPFSSNMDSLSIHLPCCLHCSFILFLKSYRTWNLMLW